VVKAKRVGLVDLIVPVDDVELVGGGVMSATDHSLPDARDPERCEGLGLGVPAVPVAHDRYPVGAGCPHGKVGSTVYRMSPQLLIETEMGSLVPQIDVVLGEERIGLVG
jgi:hypothetical protein